MKSGAIVLGLAATAHAVSLPKASRSSGSIPAGCSTNFDGLFEISVKQIDNDKRQQSYCGEAADSLVLTLSNGILKDRRGRTGYIASNHQFQFDAPPQYNALVTSGFSACENNVLALGNSKVFYECEADKFYNLYNANIAPQCHPVTITIWPCDGPHCPEGGHKDKPPIVWEISDGQIQAPWKESSGHPGGKESRSL